jgi:aminopeptidase-like protein
MWLATKFGFFSVVRTEDGKEYKIRSRAKKDLLNLFNASQIIEVAHADYRYRVIANQKQFEEFMQQLQDIEYDNFKSHIYTLPEQKDKVPYYGRIWQVMHDYQEREKQ